MKKIFMIMAAAAMLFVTACEKDDAENGGTGEDGMEQEGDDKTEQIFGLRTSQNGETVFTDGETVWRLEKQSDGTYTLFMDKTHFVERMPMLDMEVRGLVNESGHDDTFAFSTDEIIPYFNDTEFPSYILYDFDCTLNNGIVRVTFLCVGYEVSYAGMAK